MLVAGKETGEETDESLSTWRRGAVGAAAAAAHQSSESKRVRERQTGVQDARGGMQRTADGSGNAAEGVVGAQRERTRTGSSGPVFSHNSLKII